MEVNQFSVCVRLKDLRKCIEMPIGKDPRTHSNYSTNSLEVCQNQEGKQEVQELKAESNSLMRNSGVINLTHY